MALDGEAAPELELAVHLERLAAPDRREPHALAAHPAQGVAALLDQHLDQLRIGAILRDAVHVVEELVLGVGAEVGLGDLLLGQIRHQGLEVLDTVVDAAHGAGREAAVAARLVLGRALQHEHGDAMLRRRQRRAQGGVAATHDHHIRRRWKHCLSAPGSYLRQTLHETACRHPGAAADGWAAVVRRLAKCDPRSADARMERRPHRSPSGRQTRCNGESSDRRVAYRPWTGSASRTAPAGPQPSGATARNDMFRSAKNRRPFSYEARVVDSRPSPGHCGIIPIYEVTERK